MKDKYVKFRRSKNLTKRVTWESDGPAQKHLEKMIINNEIFDDTNWKDVKQNHKVFEEFSDEVFRRHFRDTKRVFALNVKDDSLGAESDTDKAGPSNPIIQTPKTSKQATGAIQVSGYPAIMCTFVDPDTRNDKVMITLTFPGGAKNFHFKPSADGSEGRFYFEWPPLVCDMKKLFKKSIADKTITNYHPKIIAAENELEKIKPNVSVNPTGFIQVKFPIRIKTDPGSYVKTVIKKDDQTFAIVVEMSAFEKEYNITENDTSIVV